MAASGRLKELVDSVKGRAAFPPEPHVVALSGGADSAALAFVSSIAGDLQRCVHVHHGMPGSDVLASAAEAIASALGVAFEPIKVSVPDGPSRENQARLVRYEGLGRVVSPELSLLLGHTRNDQAETVLMNLIRGAGTRGLAGIPYHRPPNVFRPFLGVTRSETREIAALAGLEFVDDPMNDDMAIRRNRIRSELIPRLEELNPNVVESLARVAGQATADDEFLDSLASAVPISIGSVRASVPAGAVLVLPAPIQARVLRRLVIAVRPREGLTAAELSRVNQVLNGSSSSAELESGFRVRKNAGQLLVERFG